MANRFHNPMQEKPKKGPGLKKPMMAPTPSMTMKPGFNTGVPGKKQPKDRSAGVKRAPVYPTSEGL